MRRYNDEISVPDLKSLSVASPDISGAGISREDVEERLRLFLERQLLVEFGSDIDRSTDLFREGLIDSYAYIEIMRFIESEFGVVLSDEEMLLSVEVCLTGLSDLAWKKRTQAH